MDEIEIKKVLETILFITDHPLPVERLAQICNLKEKKIENALEELKKDYQERTLQIMNVAGGYQMATRQDYSLWVRRLYHNRMTVRLSAAALETLSIIAYKQPITRADIELIRGVEVIGPLETLIERRLITAVGRKESVGRPLLYGTSNEFLRQFGLNSLDGLPDISTMIDEDAKSVKEDETEMSVVTPPLTADETATEEELGNSDEIKDSSDDFNKEIGEEAEEVADDGEPYDKVKEPNIADMEVHAPAAAEFPEDLPENSGENAEADINTGEVSETRENEVNVSGDGNKEPLT